MKFIKNMLCCVHLEDTKILWEKNHNSPWLNVKEHYIDVHSMFTLDGWTPFIPYVITSSYNLPIWHALGFWKVNMERSNVTKYCKFLFMKSRVMPQTNKLFWPNLRKNYSYDILGAGMLWKPEEARILKNFINQRVNIR
jgi:hypothetical protein